MSGLLDVQIKKQQNTWSNHKQWIRGSDGDLLLELYTIYQKWGLQTVVVAMTAMEHIFAQDAKKRAFIAQALLLVDELRKKLRKSEADTTSKATESKHSTTEITKEMIFDRIKDTKILREKNATRSVDTYQLEYSKEESFLQSQTGQVDDTRLREIQTLLRAARGELSTATESLIKGVGAYSEQDYKEAIAALTPDESVLGRLMEGVNRKQQPSSSSSTVAVADPKIDSKEAADQLKDIWRSLLKAVILQNTDRGQGEVSYRATEKNRESLEHLGSLSSNEMAAVSAMSKGKAESMVAYAVRLQEKERFLQWVASSLLVTGEQESILRYANGVLFEALKKTLPMESMWMANQRNADGKMTFVRLGMLVIEVYSKQSDDSTQEEIPPASKPGGFVALKGALSRKKGTRVTSEERTEEFNKKVSTKYRPGEPPPGDDDSESDQEEDLGVLHKISSDAKTREIKKTKIARPADKDQGIEGHRAGKETKRAPEEDDIVCASERTMFLAIINLLSAKHEDKPRPVVHECFEYSKHGSCRFGERCRFHHQEDKYEASTLKKRRVSPPRDVKARDNSNARMCLDFDRGQCTFGDNCRFSHDENIFRARYKDGDL